MWTSESATHTQQRRCRRTEERVCLDGIGDITTSTTELLGAWERRCLRSLHEAPERGWQPPPSLSRDLYISNRPNHFLASPHRFCITVVVCNLLLYLCCIASTSAFLAESRSHDEYCSETGRLRCMARKWGLRAPYSTLHHWMDMRVVAERLL